MSDNAKDAKKDNQEDRVFLVPYPKIVFFYPTYLAALGMALWLIISDMVSEGNHFKDVTTGDTTVVIGTWVFLIAFAINLVVITFDFPRGTSLTLFFLVVAAVLGCVLLGVFYPDLVPAVGDYLKAVKPVANTTFFLCMVALFTLMYIATFISVRFDYWEVTPNELLHHSGIMSDLKRYSAPNLRVDKEINDIFEYLLLGSGRLILHPSNERRAVVLENVLFISKKEERLTEMLGALKVDIRTDA